jgi:hypothetical protein
VIAISFWESKDNAEAYEHASYAEVLKALEKVIEKKPEVKTLQLAYSTMHKPGTVAFPKQSPNITPTAGVGG